MEHQPAPLPRPVVPPRFGLAPALTTPAVQSSSPPTAPAQSAASARERVEKQASGEPHSCTTQAALLSFFDGIGSAHQSLLDLRIEPLVSWSWEVDPDCNKVVRQRHPRVVLQGDALSADPRKAVQALKDQCPPETFVVVACAPPCPDFSQIKGDKALGTKGEEGQKFAQWVTNWYNPFRKMCRFKFALLLENVTMAKDTQVALDDLVGVRSFVCDAASFGLVSRPRLWWCSSLSPPEAEATAPPEAASGMARWRRWNRQWELVPASSRFPRQVAAECKFAKFNEKVERGSVRFPCLTTPAPTPEGRPPPPKRKRDESPQTLSRWRADNQQYAPWQYRDYALVEEKGKVAPPSAAVREFLHDYPPGYTKAVPERARCTQLGNSWHLPTSRFILFVVLLTAQVVKVKTQEPHVWYEEKPFPVFELKFHPDGSRPLLRACSWWRRFGRQWDPNEPQAFQLQGPLHDEKEHVRWSTSLSWEQAFPINLNPCLEFAIEQQERMGGKVVQWRETVVDDVQSLVEELREDQDEWLSQAPEHVQQVYKQGTPKFVVQLLAFAHLLQLLDFPEWENLVADLFWGFRLLGPLPPGSSWHLRQDNKYSSPWSPAQFQSFNMAHVVRLLASKKEDEHSATMKAELLEEAQKSRFAGPFSAQWLESQAKSHRVFAAKAFPVVQGPKVRRADDWLRSGHNATVWAGDTPPYQGTPTIISGIRRVARSSSPELSAVDHEGAYRNFPVRSPLECATVLPEEGDERIWLHRVLPFGSSGSVWSYIRFADAVCFLSISLLMLAAAHFVDDFYKFESAKTSKPAFASFQKLRRIIGTKMKEAKAKPPDRKQTLLGVEWTISDDELLASPGPSRIEKLVARIKEVLAADALSPQEVAKLAGKLNFTCSWVFGQAGTALLKPLFARQQSGIHKPTSLSSSLRSALKELQKLLPELKPVRIPLRPQDVQVCVLYADAYINIAGSRRAANRWLKQGIPHDVLQESSNGWGAIFLPPSGRRLAFRSEVPNEVLRKTATSKAFIFWLEMMAQVLAVLTIAEGIQGHVLCFVDNSAAEHALQKGFSRDIAFTKVLGCFARHMAAKGLVLSFHRVTSAANVSDGVSRDDWSAAAELECKFAKFDFSKAYKWFRKLPNFNRLSFPSSSSSPSTWARREWGTARVSGVSRAVRTEHRPRAGGPEGIPGRRPKDRPKTLGIGTKSPHRGLSECLRFYSYGGVLVVFCTCAKSDKQYVVHSFVRTAVRFSSHFRFLQLQHQRPERVVSIFSFSHHTRP